MSSLLIPSISYRIFFLEGGNVDACNRHMQALVCTDLGVHLWCISSCATLKLTLNKCYLNSTYLVCAVSNLKIMNECNFYVTPRLSLRTSDLTLKVVQPRSRSLESWPHCQHTPTQVKQSCMDLSRPFDDSACPMGKCKQTNSTIIATQSYLIFMIGIGLIGDSRFSTLR